MHILYSFCFTLGFLLMLPYFLVQTLWHKKYISSFRQRLGFLPAALTSSTPGRVWIHAVSVGEVLAILPLAKAVRDQWPHRPLFISTTTLTGQRLAEKKLSDVARVFYFPFDWRFSSRKSLNRIRPEIVLIAETEIWPNFLRECKLCKIPVMLINGRISDQSFPRYRKVRWFLKRVLTYFDYFGMQSQMDLERIRSLGAAPGRAEVCGNLKYEVGSPQAIEGKVEEYRRLLGLEKSSFLLVAGSTMKDEEILVLSAFRRLRETNPAAVLMLAPRHPERFKEVELLLKEQSFQFLRRSAIKPDQEPSSSSQPEVILLDSMGELATLYALADVVFIGGSLVPKGGHNLLEPALFKKAVLFGPHMSNFRAMAEDFLRQKAALQVDSAKALADKLIELYQDSNLRQQIGENGYRILAVNRGATERIVKRMESLLVESSRSLSESRFPF